MKTDRAVVMLKAPRQGMILDCMNIIHGSAKRTGANAVNKKVQNPLAGDHDPSFSCIQGCAFEHFLSLFALSNLPSYQISPIRPSIFFHHFDSSYPLIAHLSTFTRSAKNHGQSLPIHGRANECPPCRTQSPHQRSPLQFLVVRWLHGYNFCTHDR